MANKLIIFAILLLLNITFDSKSQFSINMPIERSVFQRINNKATIQIGGQTDVFLNQIQVKLDVISGGTPIAWTTVNTHVEPGNFRCQIADVAAGWYSMQIRGISNGVQVGIDAVEKVGVGEVFLIAGQSNAQGGKYPHPSFYTQVYYGANDDRVNGINYFTENPDIAYPLPIFEKIAPITDLAPKGSSAWCWATLGDKIAMEWNVPVAFFNAAVGATTAADWSNSANSSSQPYIYLKKTLEYYTKIYGVRAVLWHQGESDGFSFNQNLPQSYTDYTNNITNLINRSRADAHGNISWIISRVSRLADDYSNNLIQCQTDLSNTPNFNCFLGPYTDDIQPDKNDRDGWAHFRAEGLLALADVWYSSINNSNFINNSNPIAATHNLQIVDNQFVFGNSTAPRLGINQTISSGDWHNPGIWSNGAVPNSLNEIIITEGHTVYINNKTIYVKNLVLNGVLNLESGGNIVLVE